MMIEHFLLARIAEDEALARAAIQPSEMYPYGDTRLPATPVEGWGDDVRGYLGGTWGEHCAQHDPIRVLAECAAKRAIVEDCRQPSHDDLDNFSTPAPMWVARALATVYSDHPDYQDEWKP